MSLCETQCDTDDAIVALAMLRGRPALEVVFLCFVCVLSLKPQPDARICSQDIILRVEFLIKKAPNLWLNSRLYTPNLTDYQQKCPSSTFKCFAAEIKVLTDEWKTFDNIPKFKLNILLGELATSFNQTESECRQCELFKEQNAEKFLKDLLSTLQFINEQYC
ncbi:interleukin 15, like isoform X3 [Seriola aureovittata]|uniref:interleukin 15, like isoform X3 n=1 Tax=Seriola aureovittata TaxID=2871759 RepID=UPI0024BE980F|nr:interleukin 15, like isoform X3 [Seriola aureovittata]